MAPVGPEVGDVVGAGAADLNELVLTMEDEECTMLLDFMAAEVAENVTAFVDVATALVDVATALVDVATAFVVVTD